MGDVVDLAARRLERSGHGSAIEGTSIVARHVARVRAIRAAWHPSLGIDPIHGDPPQEVVAQPTAGAVDRLERAMRRIERATGRPVGRAGRFGPEVETELLALVGQLSLGLVTEAADRAERVADQLGRAASSRP